jgi:hypothetical protein
MLTLCNDLLILWRDYLKVCFTLPQLRRERIAERIRALQELVPTVNKVCTFHPNPHLYIISLESLTLSVSPVFVCRPIELL